MKYILTIPSFVITLFFFQFKVFSAAQADSTVTYPLLFNRHCLNFDAANTSGRKNIYDADAYARMQAWSTCSSDSFPDIDFSKQLLLYVFYAHSGCTPNVERKLICYMDHVNKKVILKVVVYDKGVCRPMYYKQEFFPIPIIPKNYSVEVHTPNAKSPLIIPAEE